jgi:hypothetical protein
MNRCQALIHSIVRSSGRRQLLQLVLAAPLVGLAAAASAQTTVRAFAPNVQRGALVVVIPPVIQLDGKADRLSPGARIRGPNNMLLMSGAIVGQSLVVNYLRNTSGEVHDVWVLTAAEAALPLPAQP